MSPSLKHVKMCTKQSGVKAVHHVTMDSVTKENTNRQRVSLSGKGTEREGRDELLDKQDKKRVNVQTQGCVLSSWPLRSRASLLVDRRREKHTPEPPQHTCTHPLSPPHDSHLLKTMRAQAPPSEQCSHVCARFSSVLCALRGSSTRTHRPVSRTVTPV